MTIKIAKDTSGQISPNLFTLSESYFGSQWAILKSNVSLVTNMSLSNLTSWTLGGGRAMASPMNPITIDGFFDFDDVCTGLSLPSRRTTLKRRNIG